MAAHGLTENHERGQMRGRYLRGYGAVSPEAEQLLDAAVSEMQAQVREIERVITTHGPVDLRWLRQAKHPNTNRDGVPSPSIQE